jgi:hypothetical protein
MPTERKIEVRKIVSGKSRIWTAIQVISPRPSVPVSQGATQWSTTVSAAAAIMATPLPSRR